MKVLVLVLSSLAICHSVVAAQPENHTFVATNEWQEVEEGQQITAGLHVRINLTTGKKEAKLLNDKNRTESKEAAIATLPDSVTTSSVLGGSKHRLKVNKNLEDALKNVQKNDRLALDYTPEKNEKIKAKFKSYEELKNMRKSFKTDAEVITQLISDYRNATKDDEDASVVQIRRLRILENFDYMLHQIDNALWFIDAGGLDNLLLPLVVNETVVGIRVQAMRVLGALTQNNPKAQIKVFERNFGSHLAQIISTSTHTEELSTALYAFGTLLRKFPLAQQRILSTSGTQALISVLSKECELKIKAKAATLISDLIVEKQLTMMGDVDPIAVSQYAEISLAEWLLSNGYCEAMDSLLTQNLLLEFIEQPDLLEYIVHALNSTKDICFSLWTQSPQLKHILLTLKARYSQSNDEFRGEIAERLQQLLLDLYHKGLPHEEL